MTAPTADVVRARTRRPVESYPPGWRVSLWERSRPMVALQACVDYLAKQLPADQEQARWDLPCEVCPEKVRCLTAKAKEIGPLMYSRELRTRPRSGEASLFPPERMEPLKNHEIGFVPVYVKPTDEERRWWVASGWDIAWSERTGGDYLVRQTAVLDRHTGRRRWLDICRWRGMSFTNQLIQMATDWLRYGDDIVVLEEAAAQRIWADELERLVDQPSLLEKAGLLPEDVAGMPVAKHGTSDKRDLATGVPGMLLDVDRQAWELPFLPGSYHHDHAEAFLTECEAFGVDPDTGKLEGQGEHDDTVMAWWHLTWGIEQGRITKRVRARTTTRQRTT